MLLSLFVGCGTAPIPGTDDASRPRPEDGTTAVPPVQSPIIENAGENGVFDGAQPATLPVAGELVIEGAINAVGDVDIYDLGPAIAGDRIIVDVTGHDGLNTAAALFDAGLDLIDANDDRSYYAGVLDPYIAQVIREGTDNVYLGIAVSSAVHFASMEGRLDSGAYSVRVRREPEAVLPVPQHQVVYLDFDGGDSVQIALEPVEVMQPFSAESISSRFAGQTGYIISVLLDHMRYDFARYDVTLLDSVNHSVPAGPHSTLYFGNANPYYLGLADNVDTGNIYLEQEAIIYAEDLALFESLVPSAEEIALALGNIASHELGHLLGLEHTADVGDLMATASSARELLEVDGAFERARLLAGVFPTGWQNGPNLLWQNVGANPSGGSNARLRFTDVLPWAPPSFRDALEDIPIVPCGRCSGRAATH